MYAKVIDQIQRSVNLGLKLSLARPRDTRVAAGFILGGIKDVVLQAARSRSADSAVLVAEIRNFGLCGVVQPELTATIANSAPPEESFFSAD